MRSLTACVWDQPIKGNMSTSWNHSTQQKHSQAGTDWKTEHLIATVICIYIYCLGLHYNSNRNEYHTFLQHSGSHHFKLHCNDALPWTKAMLQSWGELVLNSTPSDIFYHLRHHCANINSHSIAVCCCARVSLRWHLLCCYSNFFQKGGHATWFSVWCACSKVPQV